MAYKFRVGDKVSSGDKQGTIVGVVKGNILNYRVEWDSTSHEYNWFQGRELDKVIKAPVKVIPKVGDICRITENRPYGAALKEGDIVIIKQIEKDGDDIYASKVDDDSVNWLLDMDVMEPIKKETITTKIEKTMATVHEQILAELKLEVGDIVEITHKVPDRNLGWNNDWNPEMDKSVGKQGVVIAEPKAAGVRVEIEGIAYSFTGYNYPAQSIKFISKGPKFKEMKISKDYTAKVYADRIEVGCQTITMENFEKLQKLVAEIKK